MGLHVDLHIVPHSFNEEKIKFLLFRRTHEMTKDKVYSSFTSHFVLEMFKLI